MTMATAGEGQGAIGEDYYRANYQDYERQTSAAKLRFYLELVGRWVPQGASLFELGVGLGHFLEAAAAHYDVAGSEINLYGVQQARARVPRARVSEGSFEVIPADGGANAVVSWDVLEHLPDLDAGLAAIHARLAAGGYLIGVVPVYDGPLGWLVTMLDHDPTHVSKFGRSEWLRRLERHGFQVVEHGGILRKLVAGRYVHLTRPQLVLRACGSALYFVAWKKDGPPPGSPK